MQKDPTDSTYPESTTVIFFYLYFHHLDFSTIYIPTISTISALSIQLAEP